MQSRPFYQEFASDTDFSDDIYVAMRKKDLSEAVLAALKKLKETNKIPPLVRYIKCEKKSTAYRQEGNTAYGAGKYQQAYELYNKALLYAPLRSLSMKLAISNRSALLFKVQEYLACLEDIDICFGLGCPPDIQQKLKKRNEEALMHIVQNESGDEVASFGESYFALKMPRNPQIPCASTDVGVIVECEVPKVVAVKDIKVGTLVAMETPFVSLTKETNCYSSCYNCHKMSLNLMPCTGCCVALFCDERCMTLSMEEEHSIECPLMEAIEAVSTGPIRLAQKAALKMKKLCKNWDNLISASHEMGVKRIKNSSINNTFAEKHPFSLLSYREDKHLIHGVMYNSALSCAVIMHYLVSLPGFLPPSFEKKMEAMRALSRIMMFLAIYPTIVQLNPFVSIAVKKKSEVHKTANFGLYSFIGKLRNACKPNLITVTLDKVTALVAVQPIKRGTELTIAYLGHWLDQPINRDIRKKRLFHLTGLICSCDICNGHWAIPKKYIMNDAQTKSLHSLRLGTVEEQLDPEQLPQLFVNMCEALALFDNLPYSREYEAIYRIFKKCILLMQEMSAPNDIIDSC